MIEELLERYGSLQDIPDEELAKAGLKREERDGCVVIQPVRQKGQDPLLKRIARSLDVDISVIPKSASRGYLLRLARVAKQFESDRTSDAFIVHRFEGDERYAYEELRSLGYSDEAAMVELGIDPLSVRKRPLHEAFCLYLAAWSRGVPVDDLLTNDSLKDEREKVLSRLVSLGIDTEVWLSGIGEWRVEATEGRVIPKEKMLARLFEEFSTALTDLINNGLRNSTGCLQEMCQRLDVKPAELKGVLQRMKGDEKAMRTVLRIARERASRRDALNPDWPVVGLFHLDRVNQVLSRKNEHQSGVFTIRLCAKNPSKDLTIGNDGGCCIGIYLRHDEFNHGVGAEEMPKFFLDPGTQLVEVYRGTRRVGMALLYAGVDKEGRSVLIVNSVELNGRLTSVAGVIVDAIVDWVIAFSQACGFAYQVMGAHSYNTGINYGSWTLNSEDLPLVEGIRNISVFDDLYGDVVSSDSIKPYVQNVVPFGPGLKPEPLPGQVTFDQLRARFPVVLGPRALKGISGVTMELREEDVFSESRLETTLQVMRLYADVCLELEFGLVMTLDDPFEFISSNGLSRAWRTAVFTRSLDVVCLTELPLPRDLKKMANSEHVFPFDEGLGLASVEWVWWIMKLLNHLGHLNEERFVLCYEFVGDGSHVRLRCIHIHADGKVEVLKPERATSWMPFPEKLDPVTR